MKQSEIETELTRTPFQPMNLIKADGTVVSIPFAHVAVIIRDALLVFVGVKSATSHSAERYLVIPFDRIDRMEPQRTPRKRRKAS